MFCYPLKFPKFEVVNWIALVVEELGMKIALEWLRYVAQVYYKRKQWHMQEKCFVILWSSLSFISLSCELESLGFRGTGYTDCVRIVYICSPSVLQVKPMTYAKDMFCYPLKFPKFEVVNWIALVVEELGMKIAWEGLRYVAQVYCKRNQWNLQEKCFVIPWSSLSLELWTGKPWF